MAIDVFLNLAGITGETRDQAFKGATELRSATWGFTLPGTSMGQYGKPDPDEIVVLKAVDSTSPTLLQALNTTTPIKSGRISIRRAGTTTSTPNPFLIIDLADVVVRRITAETVSAEDVPAEQVTLEFRQATWTYRRQNPDGTWSTVSSFTYTAPMTM